MIWLLVGVRLPLAMACLGLLAVALQLFLAGIVQLHSLTGGMGFTPHSASGSLVESALPVIDAFGLGLALVLVASSVLVAFVARPLSRSVAQQGQLSLVEDVSQLRRAMLDLLVMFGTVAMFRIVLATDVRLDWSTAKIPALIAFVLAVQMLMRIASPAEPARPAAAAPAKPPVQPVKPPVAPVAVKPPVAAPAKPPVAPAPAAVAKPAVAAAPAKPAVAPAAAAAAAKPAAVPAAAAVAKPAVPAAAAAAAPKAAPAALPPKPVAAIPAKPVAAIPKPA
ncbi:MAG: YqhA family protein [Hyphomicrobiaceae bacterium]